MKVYELMSIPIATCSSESNLAEAAMLMWRNDCGAIAIVDGNGAVTGMITDRDICIAAATRHTDIATITVGSVISRPVTCCSANDELDVVLAKMGEQQVRRLPVIDEEGKPQGIISINDLILAVGGNRSEDGSHLPVESLLTALRRISSHWLPAAPDGASATNSKKKQSRRRSGATA